MRVKVDRRQFLQGVAGAGLSFYFSVPASAATGDAAPRKEEGAPYSPNAHLSIYPDGKIVVHIDKAEMGQGVSTALAQIVAEEMEADWNDVVATLNTYTVDQGFVFTATSLSIFGSFESVSRAAAAARLTLVDTAAEHWGVAADECRASNSAVVHGDRRMSFGELAGIKPKSVTLSESELQKIQLKQPSEYKIVGTDKASPHQTAKAQGRLAYGIDKSLPGMVYAKVAYPPSSGATHVIVDDAAAKRVPGYLHTVVNPHLVAAVADSYGAAVAARDALDVKWSEGPNSAVNSEKLWEVFESKVSAEEGRPWVLRGDAAAALESAPRRYSQKYSTDLVAHLQMEPYNCTADYRDGQLHLYCGTQYPSRLAAQAAAMCDVDPAKVFIHGQYMGSGFGALLETEWHAHAGVISKAVGKPVKLILSREEDTANDAFRSPSYHKLTCGVRDDGSISGWEHRVVCAWPSSRHRVFLNGEGFDSYALSGGDHHYAIDDQHVRAIEHDLGPPVGYVRGVACGYMFFAIESFLDELAHETDQDPLEMRLAMLQDRPRLARVLKQAAEMGGWGKEVPENTGLGLAAATAQDSEANTTRVGAVARARVDPSSGQIKVERISCAVDCGVVINPNGAKSQAESALLYGLSIALKGGGTLENGRIVERNFDAYPVLRMSDVPDLEIEFVKSTNVPTGMGEPTMACIAPALANAIFAASGARIRSLPFTPERMRAAQESRSRASYVPGTGLEPARP